AGTALRAVAYAPRYRCELAGGLGFEPRQAESESAVLPLDDPPTPGGTCAGSDGQAAAVWEGGGSKSFPARQVSRSAKSPIIAGNAHVQGSAGNNRSAAGQAPGKGTCWRRAQDDLRSSRWLRRASFSPRLCRWRAIPRMPRQVFRAP